MLKYLFKLYLFWYLMLQFWDQLGFVYTLFLEINIYSFCTCLYMVSALKYSLVPVLLPSLEGLELGLVLELPKCEKPD